MKRTALTLSLVVIAGLILCNSEAKAMTAAQVAAVQASQQVVAHPGHHHGHHGHQGYRGHRGHNFHRWGPPLRHYPGPRTAPVIIYGPRSYPPYGYPSSGGVVVNGRGWGFGFSF